MNAEPDARGPSVAAPPTWLDVLDDVLDEAVEVEESLECRFEDLAVDVPLRMGEDAPRARWRLDGTVRVHVEGRRGPLAEWLRWWHRQVDRDRSGRSADPQTTEGRGDGESGVGD
jgi:hypothetical protein